MTDVINNGKDAPIALNVIDGQSKHDLIIECLAVIRRGTTLKICVHAHGDKIYSLEIDNHVHLRNQTEDELFKVLTGMLLAVKYL